MTAPCPEAQWCRHLARFQNIRMPAPAEACAECPLLPPDKKGS